MYKNGRVAGWLRKLALYLDTNPGEPSEEFVKLTNRDLSLNGNTYNFRNSNLVNKSNCDPLAEGV